MNRRTQKKAVVLLLLAAFIFTLWQMPAGRSEAAAAKSVAGSWKKDSKGWWYKFSDGSGYAKNEYIIG